MSPETLEEHQAIWDEAVANNIFVICKTPMAKSITRRTLVGFRNAKVNTRYFEDLINQIKNKPDNFLTKVVKGKSYWKTNNNDKMKFSAVVGNPPYQTMDGGGTGSSAQAIYNKFVDVARLLQPKYISMIIPSRWMTGGKGLDKFRESLLNDKQIRLLHDYLDANECFPNVSIEGGICYFRWELNNEGKCTYVSHLHNSKTISERYLSEFSTDVVIRDSSALPILKKISINNNDDNFSSLVSPRNLFKVDTQLIKSSYEENDLKVFGRFNGTRGLMYVSTTLNNRALRFIGKWKVFVSKADGAAGQLGNPIPARIIGKAELGDCDTICTETFLVIGPFDTMCEANNVIKYLTTKFSRFLIGVRKLKNMTQETYSFVPLQDFTSSSDIDWSQSISEIDKQLYAKYGLSEEEINFIEKMIKPM